MARQLLNCAPSPVKHEQARSQGLSSPTPTLKGAEMKGTGSEVKAAFGTEKWSRVSSILVALHEKGIK